MAMPRAIVILVSESINSFVGMNHVSCVLEDVLKGALEIARFRRVTPRHEDDTA
jgi:hypothetical protein